MLSKASLEMRRYLEELSHARYYTTHLIIEELTSRLVDAQSIRELTEVFKDVDYDVITDCAIQALVAVGNDLVVDVLVHTLRDPEPMKVIAAAQTLGRIGNPRAVPALVKVLKHPNGVVRAKAALALGEMGDPSVLEPLVRQLTDEDWRARAGAIAALSHVANERALEPLVAAFYQCDLDADELSPWLIVKALGRINTLPAIEALLSILADTRLYGEIRKEAMLSLGRIGNKVAFEPLVDTMTKEDMQATGAEALGLLGDVRAVDILVPLLDHAKPIVRGNAAQALGLLKDRRALPYLKQMSQADKEYYAAGISLSDIANEAIALIEQDKS